MKLLNYLMMVQLDPLELFIVLTEEEVHMAQTTLIMEAVAEYRRIMNTFLTEKNNGSNDPNYTPKGKPCPK